MDSFLQWYGRSSQDRLRFYLRLAPCLDGAALDVAVGPPSAEDRAILLVDASSADAAPVQLSVSSSDHYADWAAVISAQTDEHEYPSLRAWVIAAVELWRTLYGSAHEQPPSGRASHAVVDVDADEDSFVDANADADAGADSDGDAFAATAGVDANADDVVAIDDARGNGSRNRSPRSADFTVAAAAARDPSNAQELRTLFDAWSAMHPALMPRWITLETESRELMISILHTQRILSVYFSDRWQPLAASSADDDLGSVLQPLNDFLTERWANPLTPPSLMDLLDVIGSPETARSLLVGQSGVPVAPRVASHDVIVVEDDDAPTLVDNAFDTPIRGTSVAAAAAAAAAAQPLHFYRQNFHRSVFDATQRSEPPYVEPTPLDWEERIVPALDAFMESRGLEKYEREEWIRRVRTHYRSTMIALRFVMSEILQTSPIPNSIRHFFPLSMREHEGSLLRRSDNLRRSDFDVLEVPEDLRDALRAELDSVRQIDAVNPGGCFVCAAPHVDQGMLWSVGFTHLPHTHPLRAAASASAAASPALPERLFAEDLAPSEQREAVVFEFRCFEGDRRLGAPAHWSMRLVQPTVQVVLMNRPDTPVQLADALAAEFRDFSPVYLGGLSAALVRLRSFLLESVLDAKDDYGLGSAAGSMSVTGFWDRFSVDRSVMLDQQFELGGKIILPASVLEHFLMADTEDRAVAGPMFKRARAEISSDGVYMFELSVDGRRCYAGVEQFDAAPGHIIVPHWMSSFLLDPSSEKSIVEVRRVQLPKAQHLLLRPHSDDIFNAGQAQRELLEHLLSTFTVLYQGQILHLVYAGRKLVLDVVRAFPAPAVCVVNTDVSVDFDLSGTPGAAAAAAAASSARPAASASAAAGAAGAAASATGGSVLGGMVDAEGGDVCPTCRRPVPAAQMAMHSLRCARLNWYCDLCKVVVEANRRAEHEREAHTDEPCPLCGNKFPSFKLEAHLKDCPMRPQLCTYCSAPIPFAEYADHHARCGTKTTECSRCGQIVMRRLLSEHEASCGRPPVEFFCEFCGAPFEQFDELQVHFATIHSALMEN
jgi:hypothetical protein